MMSGIKLVFYGTKGYHKITSPQHKYHSAMMLIYEGESILFDCGLDWKDKIDTFKPHPNLVVITHEHPDHGGCTLSNVLQGKDFSAPIVRVPTEKLITQVGSQEVTIVPIRVRHAKLVTIAPKVTISNRTLVYAPDLLALPSLDVLENVQLYIGDGATVRHPLRFTSEVGYVGHASMYQQVMWCRMKGVKRVIFTHFGSWATPEVEPTVLAQMRRDFPQLTIEFAHDGWSTKIR